MIKGSLWEVTWIELCDACIVLGAGCCMCGDGLGLVFDQEESLTRRNPSPPQACVCPSSSPKTKVWTCWLEVRIPEERDGSSGK